MKTYRAFIQFYRLDDGAFDLPVNPFDYVVELPSDDDKIMPSLIREATRVGRAIWPKKAERMSIAIEATEFPHVVYTQQGIKRGRIK